METIKQSASTHSLKADEMGFCGGMWILPHGN